MRNKKGEFDIGDLIWVGFLLMTLGIWSPSNLFFGIGSENTTDQDIGANDSSIKMSDTYEIEEKQETTVNDDTSNEGFVKFVIFIIGVLAFVLFLGWKHKEKFKKIFLAGKPTKKVVRKIIDLDDEDD